MFARENSLARQPIKRWQVVEFNFFMQIFRKRSQSKLNLSLNIFSI